LRSAAEIRAAGVIQSAGVGGAKAAKRSARVISLHGGIVPNVSLQKTRW
jgi:hypothetical protein